MTDLELKDYCDLIRSGFKKMTTKCEALEKENKQLKESLYKDVEIEHLQMQIMSLKYRANHFGMWEKDYEHLKEWFDKHKVKHINNSNLLRKIPDCTYHIQIDEFAECTCYSIICDKCNECSSVYY